MAAFVIASVGRTYDGRLAQAIQLIYAARLAGADAIRFDYCGAPDRLAARRGVDVTAFPWFRSRYWLDFLRLSCGLASIEFMCAVGLPEDVDVIAPHVQRFYVPPFDADCRDMIDAHRPYWRDRDVLINLAHSPELTWIDCDPTLGHVRELLAVTKRGPGLVVLQRHGHDGMTDGSRHPWMGALAVANGAQIIEAHLRLDDTDPQNPDYATAFSPAEFAGYVHNIRFAETVMGDGVKQLQRCERDMAQYRVGGTS